MSETFKAATVRALYQAVIAAGLSFFVTLQTAAGLIAGDEYRVAGIAAGVSFFSILALRGGVEGIIDSTRTTPTAADVGVQQAFADGQAVATGQAVEPQRLAYLGPKYIGWNKVG